MSYQCLAGPLKIGDAIYMHWGSGGQLNLWILAIPSVDAIAESRLNFSSFCSPLSKGPCLPFRGPNRFTLETFQVVCPGAVVVAGGRGRGVSEVH